MLSHRVLSSRNVELHQRLMQEVDKWNTYFEQKGSYNPDMLNKFNGLVQWAISLKNNGSLAYTGTVKSFLQHVSLYFGQGVTPSSPSKIEAALKKGPMSTPTPTTPMNTRSASESDIPAAAQRVAVDGSYLSKLKTAGGSPLAKVVVTDPNKLATAQAHAEAIAQRIVLR